MNPIRRARLSANLSQAELGLLADLDQSVISRIEHGKRTVTVPELLRIAMALKVRPEHLLAPMLEPRQ